MSTAPVRRRSSSRAGRGVSPRVRDAARRRTSTRAAPNAHEVSSSRMRASSSSRCCSRLSNAASRVSRALQLHVHDVERVAQIEVVCRRRARARVRRASASVNPPSAHISRATSLRSRGCLAAARMRSKRAASPLYASADERRIDEIVVEAGAIDEPLVGELLGLCAHGRIADVADVTDRAMRSWWRSIESALARAASRAASRSARTSRATSVRTRGVRARRRKPPLVERRTRSRLLATFGSAIARRAWRRAASARSIGSSSRRTIARGRRSSCSSRRASASRLRDRRARVEQRLRHRRIDLRAVIADAVRVRDDPRRAVRDVDRRCRVEHALSLCVASP